MVFVGYQDWSAWGYGISYKISMAPYKNKFVQDSGATYPDLSPFAAFEDSSGSGYSFPPANISAFQAALELADVIIDETYPNLQTLDGLKTQYGFTEGDALPPAFANSRVYTLDGTMNGPTEYDGIDWFESRIAEP